ncbi:hypothetical protein [Achromobacter mucicolens]|uniref:hypothetical protein n=1 Tax=Achromobacter mucicolens TaxID=1389922 RepID=UPI003D75A57D
MKRSACLAALLLCLAAPLAHADYPERAITLIVPAAADGYTIGYAHAGTLGGLRPIARSDDGDCLLQVAPALPLDALATRF